MSNIFNNSSKKRVKNSNEIKKPPKYKVIFINDPFTSYNFILKTLITLFNKNEEEADKLFYQFQEEGKIIVGYYCKEIAVTKKFLADKNAELYDMPLTTYLEKD